MVVSGTNQIEQRPEGNDTPNSITFLFPERVHEACLRIIM